MMSREFILFKVYVLQFLNFFIFFLNISVLINILVYAFHEYYLPWLTNLPLLNFMFYISIKLIKKLSLDLFICEHHQLIKKRKKKLTLAIFQFYFEGSRSQGEDFH